MCDGLAYVVYFVRREGANEWQMWKKRFETLIPNTI